ncbi:MAG: MATE family efflux transporter, partial [Oscillospiraceae bacterium]|nr:MATE family efflux transporter [Oscillospiraceae bacterium]
MQFITRDRQFYKTLAALTTPMAMQNLVNFGVSMADTVMVGMIGEVHLAALSLANQLSFVFILLMFGLGSGSSVMVAQYWGKGDLRSIHKVITLMYRFVFAAAVLFAGMALFLPGHVMRVFTTDAATVEVGAQYLRYAGISYIPLGIAGVTMMMLRAIRAVRISLIVSSVSLVVNVFLNWVLIFGNLGMPAMGVRGAAVTTVFSRSLELVIILFYMARFERKLCYRLRYLFMPGMRFIREYAFTALPVVANELLWGAGSAMIAVIIGRMGTEFTAANAVCATLGQLVTVVIFGVANAGTVVMGNTVGAGKYEHAREQARAMICISL